MKDFNKNGNLQLKIATLHDGLSKILKSLVPGSLVTRVLTPERWGGRFSGYGYFPTEDRAAINLVAGEP